MNARLVSLTIGTALTVATLGATVRPAAAQTAPAPKFGIADNSFLVEEAFNQETGVFQNIFVMSRSRHGVWNGSFTQEWPAPGMRHQLSVTAPLSVFNGSAAVGDGLINYRFQVSNGEGRMPAFSPRLSAVLPTSADRRAYGTSGVGWQVNLPASKQFGALFVHANAGSTMMRDGKGSDWQQTPFVAGSVIVALRPMFNLMFATYSESRPELGGRERVTTYAPGFRTGWNIGDKQWIIGIAVPITRGATHDTGVLGYLSYELPFRSLSSKK